MRSLERSRLELLASLDGARKVTFIRSYGNVGDELIFAGTRQLLASVPHDEISIRDVHSAKGDLAVVSGGGAWCDPFHEVLPAALQEIENRFGRVVIFPSSFDPSVDAVHRALGRTTATVFAREPVSHRLIDQFCNAHLAHDCAFFFDYRPYRHQGNGTLFAFRTDAESTFTPPESNNDISVTCAGVTDWLVTISAHERIYTDRAHVMIAGAMLGKRVGYRGTSYHKVPAIAEWALNGFPVEPLRRTA